MIYFYTYYISEIKGGITMNFDMLKGKFNQILGDAKTEFGKLTDDELKMLEGQRDKFVGIVQEKYGIAKEEAENKVNEFLKKY